MGLIVSVPGFTNFSGLYTGACLMQETGYTKSFRHFTRNRTFFVIFYLFLFTIHTQYMIFTQIRSLHLSLKI